MRSMFKGKKMSDLQKNIAERKKRDPDFAKNYDEGFEAFKLGVMLKQARKEAGLTQEELAQKIQTKKVLFPESRIIREI